MGCALWLRTPSAKFRCLTFAKRLSFELRVPLREAPHNRRTIRRVYGRRFQELFEPTELRQQKSSIDLLEQVLLRFASQLGLRGQRTPLPRRSDHSSGRRAGDAPVQARPQAFRALRLSLGRAGSQQREHHPGERASNGICRVHANVRHLAR
jgi:hypothetical protein